MKKAVRRFLKPLFTALRKGVQFTSFWWRAFSYEITFSEYKEGTEGWKIVWKKVPRWYSPTFWIGVVVWASLTAIFSFIEAVHSLWHMKGSVYSYHTTEELKQRAEEAVSENEQQRQARQEANETYTLNAIYKGKTFGEI